METQRSHGGDIFSSFSMFFHISVVKLFPACGFLAFRLSPCLRASVVFFSCEALLCPS